MLAAALSVVACGGSGAAHPVVKKNMNAPTFNLVIDREFSGPERALLIDGFKDWERDTHGVVKFTVSSHAYDSKADVVPEVKKGECTYDVYVTRVMSSSKSVKSVDSRIEGLALGFTTSTCAARSVSMVYDRLKDPKLFRQVATHEAGHLIGLDHIPVPMESVMFPSVDKATPCATRLDMAQLCLLYECDYRSMKYCDVESKQ